MQITDKEMASRQRVAALSSALTGTLEKFKQLSQELTIPECVLALLKTAQYWQVESVAIDNREDITIPC